MKKRPLLAAALALAAPFGVWAQGQIDITTPDPREGVASSGAETSLPFSARILLTSPAYYCGGAQYTWTRDGADPKECSGHACKVYYPESGTTRGSHAARVAVSYLWGTAGSTACYPGYGEASRSYIVQYAPTVRITASPWTLQAGERGTFAASGTIDSQFAKNAALSFSWTFGDGGGASGPTVTHAWSKCGDYRVRVTVSDGALTASATDQVTVTSYNCDTMIK